MSAPRLGYLVKCFPRISETFILNEVLELERQGTDLRVYSMIRPRGPQHRHADGVRSAVTYLPYPLLPAAPTYLAAHLRLLWRFGSRYLAALGEVLLSFDRDLRERFVQAGLLATMLQRDGVTHLHAGFVHAPGSVAWLVWRITGTPFSLATHAKDLYHSRPRLLRKKLGEARLVLTCTRYNVGHLRRLTRGRIRRLRHVYHGTDLSRFAYGARTNGERPVVLTVARLVPKKGIAYLIDAAARLRERGRLFRCVVIGEGPLKASLAGRIRELRLEGTVSLAGMLDQEEVRAWYRRATAFALPCIIPPDGDRDGIPNVLVEAMACGVPCVSTSVSGVPELVRDGDTGLLVPPADAPALAAALERLLDDAALRARLRKRARGFVEEAFDVARNARTVGRELQLVMAEGAGR